MGTHARHEKRLCHTRVVLYSKVARLIKGNFGLTVLTTAQELERADPRDQVSYPGISDCKTTMLAT